MKELLEQLSLCIGLLGALGSLIAVTVPALRSRLTLCLRRLCGSEETKKELQRLQATLAEHAAVDQIRQKEADLQKEVDCCILRDLITGIYYKYAEEKALPVYELEDVTALHEMYCKRGGNSYVNRLFRQMTEEWKVLPY